MTARINQEARDSDRHALIAKTCQKCGQPFMGRPATKRNVYKYCSFPCAMKARSDFRAPIKDRIMKFVRISEAGCWEWQGTKDRHGYGRMTPVKNHPRLVHQVAYETFVGPIPDGLTIDHLCFNKICCKPQHLEPVTLAENIRRANDRRRALKRAADALESMEPKA